MRAAALGAHGEDELRAVGWWSNSGPVAEWVDVLSAISAAPDPELAVRTIGRLHIAIGNSWPEFSARLRDDSGFRARLIAVIGSSTTFADFLVAFPDQWRRLISGQRIVDYADHASAELLRAIGADADGEGIDEHTGAEAIAAMRRTYRGLLLEIAAMDLAHSVDSRQPRLSYRQVTESLTDLAEAVLRVSLAMARAEIDDAQVDSARKDDARSCRLAIIAMGKCGGRELNYVSDVDIVFVEDGDSSIAARVAAETMRIASAAAFEVDATLRPYGKTGALTATVDGYRSYYRRWAKTWEFQALLKARPVAGDVELGTQFTESVLPLVWTAAEREGFVADVQGMRKRVEQHVPAELVERELKLGRGSLRDAEFAVQLLQLVHGRADDALRVRSTVDG
ncbi:MAG: bifunctional [glutamine synthetase] adenylyltransferase/[glutamine synthetase]-adenylyl-L-tyrosine phosphorylase, partial [Sciscionella sp.]|nr:bifunctional [glutamine synthetase] adenylyltransferase/[glutamine synthetase]-adenylyl-L-tyrosine phosphorylase [Sciscionella sp.]